MGFLNKLFKVASLGLFDDSAAKRAEEEARRQREAAEAEARRQEELNKLQGANVLDNVAQVEAGGGASAAEDLGGSARKKRKQMASTTLGF